MLVDEAYFSTLFQFSTEGLTDFSDVSQSTLEKIKIRFSVSIEPIKTIGRNIVMNIEFQLLSDVVAKSILAKTGSFDAYITLRNSC